MYIVYADDQIIYHPELVDHGFAIYNPTITLEANKSGSFQFTMPVTNTHYNDLKKMKTIIAVFQNGEEIFRGRILNDERDFNNNKVIYCEGELAFLLDSIVRPYDYDGTVAGFFAFLVGNHNEQVENSKQFTVGEVTVLPDIEYKLSITEYASTWDVLTADLLDIYGGYVRVRLENGLRYLDYIASYENTNTQVVEFGKNMLDLSQYVSAENVFTTLIPLGMTYAQDVDPTEINPEHLPDGEEITKLYTEPIINKEGSNEPNFIFSLRVGLDSQRVENDQKISHIWVKYTVKTKSGTCSWSGLDGNKILANLKFEIRNTARYVNEREKIVAQLKMPSKTINTTEQTLLEWSGDVNTGTVVVTGEFINNYEDSNASVKKLPISNSMAAVAQLLKQKYYKTTIATVNDNKDFLVNTQAEELFGKILAIHTWDDVDDPAELKSLGEQYLADNISMAVKLDVTAVDLNLLNIAYEKFKIGDRIQVISAPHGIDGEFFTCSHITLDIQHPENNTYRLGREFKTLTETQITAAKDIQVTQAMLETLNVSLDAAQSVVEQMNQLINTIYDEYADTVTVLNNLKATKADIDFANIANAAITNLTANQAFIQALNAGYAQIDLANIDTANINQAKVDTIVAQAISSGDLTTGALETNFAEVDFANIGEAAVNNLLAQEVLTNYLEASFIQADGANIGTAVVNKLKVEGLADINFANITQAAINVLKAGTASITGLDAVYADINFGNITNAAINNALVNTGLFSSLTVEDDVIIGGTLAAESIAAASIKTEKLVVRGTDGLYYQLNLGKKNDGSISQSDWNALTEEQLSTAFHGENIIANSITAKQIHAGTITAEKLAVLDASQVTFSNGGTNKTMSTFISDINGLSSTVSSVETTVNASVGSIAYSYGYGTSTTQEPGDSAFIYDDMPALVNGKYIWRKTVITRNSGTPETTYEMIQGATGPQGQQGQAATQYYTYIRYSSNSDGSSMTVNPTTDSKYIGVYTGTSSTVPRYNDPGFKWSKYVGDPGSPGSPGAPGTSVTITLKEVKYSKSTNGTTPSTTESDWGTTIPSTVAGEYLWTRVIVTYSDGNTTTAYSVSYHGDTGGQGPRGPTGPTGPTGPKGNGYIRIESTQTATTNAWTGSTNEILELTAGTQILYHLKQTSASNVTINLTLNGTATGAKNAYYKGTTRLGTQYTSGTWIPLVYNGTYWYVVAPYTDNNYYDRVRYNNSIKALKRIARGNIIASNGTGYFPVASGETFNIAYAILYGYGSVSAGGTATTFYSNYPSVSLRNTKADVTLTAAQQAYIVGTLNEIKDENDNFLTNGVLFTVDEAVFTTAPDVYTGTDPNPLDGKYLIPIGLLYSTYQVYFEGGVPTLYTYKGNKLVRYPSDDIYTVTETTYNHGSRIEQLNDQILLKADRSTVNTNYNYLNGKISSVETIANANKSDLSVMSTQIAAKVSSQEVKSLINAETGTIKEDIQTLKTSALTIESESITQLVTKVDTLENIAESTALKVRSDGVYVYSGVSNDEGEVTLDENNYVKVDTQGQHIHANGNEVSWSTTDGLGAPKLSLGENSKDYKRWIFSMDGDMLNIRWIEQNEGE